MSVTIGIVCAANPSEPLQIWIGIAREREREREKPREKMGARKIVGVNIGRVCSRQSR